MSDSARKPGRLWYVALLACLLVAGLMLTRFLRSGSVSKSTANVSVPRVPSNGVGSHLATDAPSPLAERRAGSAPVLSVTVVDSETNEPLDGAIVTVMGSDAEAARTMHSNHGRVEIDLPVAANAELQVAKDGYETAHRVVPGVDVSELVVPLERSGRRITGVVRDPAGRPLPHIMVCAWPTLRGQPNFSRQSSLGDDSVKGGVLRSTTREDGSFLINVGVETAKWSLAAAGHGNVSVGATNVNVEIESKADLHVFPLHGCVIKWIDASGTALRTSSFLDSQSGNQFDMDDPRAGKVDRDWMSLELLGLKAEALYSAGTQERICLYINRTGDNSESLGPVRVLKCVPGYESQLSSVPIPRVSERLATVEIELRASVRQWCTTVLAILPPCGAETEETTMVIPPITAFLTIPNGGDTYTFSIPSLAKSEFWLGDVPAGIYEFTWRTSNGLFTCVPENQCASRVDLSQDSATLFVDTSRFGCLECAVSDENGRPYSGLVQLELSWVKSGSTDTSVSYDNFSKAPFVYENLTEGTYNVRIRYPPSLVGLSAHDVQVERGRLSKCTLR